MSIPGAAMRRPVAGVGAVGGGWGSWDAGQGRFPLILAARRPVPRKDARASPRRAAPFIAAGLGPRSPGGVEGVAADAGPLAGLVACERHSRRGVGSCAQGRGVRRGRVHYVPI